MSATGGAAVDGTVPGAPASAATDATSAATTSGASATAAEHSRASTNGRPTGLTSARARELLARHGPNALPEEPGEALWQRFVRQFRSPLIYILLFALAFDLAANAWAASGEVPLESFVIATILLLNALLGMWQERRAEQALARLEAMTAPHVRVLRDGELREIDARDVVPGDAVRLEAGDRIPADLVLADAGTLSVDESVLTGESLPVDKVRGEELMAGTLLVRGNAWAEVTRTGADSAMGRLATMLGSVVSEPSPLERRLDAFGRRVARWVLALGAVVVAAGVGAQGLEHFREVFLFAVALAVAAVPEGLPAVLTVTLALGLERMADRRAVVRRLAAVEALGSVTVIATDKTGTLTENRMEVRGLDCPGEEAALVAMAIACDAEPGQATSDPLERSLLACAAERGIDVAELRAGFHETSRRPFDSQWKFLRRTGTGGSSLVFRQLAQDKAPEAAPLPTQGPDNEGPGTTTSYLKGAPEILLERCRLSDQQRSEWAERLDAHATEGYRLIAFAKGEGETEEDLEWLGVALLWDPPRPEVADAVARARAAGIRVLMMTGDHPATAATVARQVGIGGGGAASEGLSSCRKTRLDPQVAAHGGGGAASEDLSSCRKTRLDPEWDPQWAAQCDAPGRVATGSDIEKRNDEELAALLQNTDVLARVSPEHKLRVVEVLRAGGEVVAMTGDGVNDAPALKRADVGVAMGQRGSDVTREVADLVLLDDNFATIVAAVEEGRSIYANIEKFLRFLFSTNLGEVLVVAVGAAAAVAFGLVDDAGDLLLPLTAAQLLWINLITDGAPALAIGLDTNPGVLADKPRDPRAPLFDRTSIRYVLTAGSIAAAGSLALLWALPALTGASHEAARTAAFFYLAGGQLLFAYPARAVTGRTATNRVLAAVVAVSMLLQVAVVALPAPRAAFDGEALAFAQWAAALAMMALAWLAATVMARRLARRT